MIHKFSANPWIAMWSNPRKTIREIININPKFGIYWLAIIYALQSALYMANYYSLGLTHHNALIIVISIVASPFFGIIWLYIYGWILFGATKILQGKAPAFHVRSALAWSALPLLINLVMWFVLLIFTPQSVFVYSVRGPTSIFISLIALITGIWSLVFLIQNIREVENFSLGKAIGVVVIGFIIYFVLNYIVVYLYSLISFSIAK